MNKNIVWAWVIKNCAAIFAWATLAVVFNEWWIALFALLFMSSLHQTPRKYYRICDKCGRRSDYADTPEEALEKAKKSGWIHYSGMNTDYCPDCKDEI